MTKDVTQWIKKLHRYRCRHVAQYDLLFKPKGG